MIIEGIKDILEILKNDSIQVEEVLWHRKAVDHPDFETIKKLATCDLYELTDREFKDVRQTVHSQGVFLKINLPKYTLENILNKKNFVIFLNGIQDPGNLGTIIRSSVLFGVDAILLDKNCVNLTNPKVLRAAKGYFCDIPIVENVDIQKLNGYEILAADIDETATQISDVKFKKPLCLVFGNEGQGISVNVDKKIYIPMAKTNGSLNVAVSVGIILFEVSKKWK